MRAFELEWKTSLKLQVKTEMVFMNYCDYYGLDIVIYYEIKNSDKQNIP